MTIYLSLFALVCGYLTLVACLLNKFVIIMNPEMLSVVHADRLLTTYGSTNLGRKCFKCSERRWVSLIDVSKQNSIA